MTRTRMLVLAGLVTALAGGAAISASAQATKSAYIPPVKGEARINYTQPESKRVKDEIVTVFKVQNVSTGRIAGLKVEEYWWDRQRNPVTGARYIHKKPMEPGEIITVTLNTPSKPNMDSNNYVFSHANGTIKPTRVKTLDEGKDEKKKPPKG
ncbi:MAG: hypothetical protein HY654_07080 [Acidobacteria bacterium]|nr:hypothetical protein [Acidobacteriota bacterium]